VNFNASICGIIAAYNAQETIAGVVTGVRRHLETVIVVDDGCTDGTAEAARRAGAEVILLRKNRGKGHALRVLFAEARARGFSAVIAIDADGQHDPDDIRSFLQAHCDYPEAVITGSRMEEPDQIPRSRHNSMLVGGFFISLAANQFIEDTQCGFRLYPLSVIESISLLKERYVTETEILIKAGDSGREIRSLPITVLYPPGCPTHFRSFRDVAAISSYVISYLMVKWGIEAVRPGVVNTYGGPGTGRDVFSASQVVDPVFEALMVIASLPLSVLYALWHVGARQLSVPAVCSFSMNHLSLSALVTSILFLPALLGVAVIDRVAHSLRINCDLTTGLVRYRYATPWPKTQA